MIRATKLDYNKMVDEVVDSTNNVRALESIGQFVVEGSLKTSDSHTDGTALDRRAGAAGIPADVSEIEVVRSSDEPLTWGEFCDIVRGHCDMDRPVSLYANDSYADLYVDPSHSANAVPLGGMLSFDFKYSAGGRRNLVECLSGRRLVQAATLCKAEDDVQLKFLFGHKGDPNDDNDSTRELPFTVSDVKMVESCRGRNALHLVGTASFKEFIF